MTNTENIVNCNYSEPRGSEQLQSFEEVAMAKGKESQKLIANNKKAYHDFFIDETYECGIALHGTEVKSMRMGKCSIKEAFVRIEDGEVFVYGMHVSPYEKGNIFNKDPLRVKSCCCTSTRSTSCWARSRKKGIH